MFKVKEKSKTTPRFDSLSEEIQKELDTEKLQNTVKN